jgi:nucleoside 2-deoxyribosyltransferase
MKRVTSVFLAGPDPWFPDAAAHRDRRDAMVRAAGLTPVVPGAGAGLGEAQRSEVAARLLYADTLSELRVADAVIANLTPWRGASCDPAAAFQAGFAAALGKPVLAYMNLVDEDDADPRGRVDALFGAMPDPQGCWRDAEGCEIEDFYLPETIMLWGEARRLFVIVTPEPWSDLTGLEMCLDSLKLYAE